MPIPDYQSLMLPVLQSAAQGEVKLGDVVTSLAKTLALTDEEVAQLLPSGQKVFANRVSWAKLGLIKAELIESPRHGYFRITDQGKEVLRSNPTHIDNTFLMQFDAFRRFKESMKERQEASEVFSYAETHTPDEVMRSAHQQIEAALAQELLNRILTSPPDFFECLIINLLMSMGYGGSAQEAGRALGRSGDNGVDGVIDQDALGLDRVYIQAKRYIPENSIGSGDIRDFFGSLDRHKASKGLFVTTSTFSPSAKETAEFLSKRIVLIDGTQLAKLMIRFNVGCRIEETLYVKKIDEEFFE
ncbi:restriction endonuclease [Cylindrospermopsis raciborskii]|uniref:restriction endonuclease n=1 Tax=Cylindrospermopsis raciborskii TaxID=77022 RepID=UPI0022CA4B39|nr:restriction endonuclease [Cylindrospermopsis raciborskii]MCZ2207868.1 restriction endonuclease [Cylindrospermopsis raciborskii PAMP2011]